MVEEVLFPHYDLVQDRDRDRISHCDSFYYFAQVDVGNYWALLDQDQDPSAALEIDSEIQVLVLRGSYSCCPFYYPY